MVFLKDKVADFIQLFEERKSQIRAFKGCSHLELWQDAHVPETWFTYSIWETEDDLNHYRFSSFFKDTWARTKALFADKPEAWSVLKKSIAE